MKLCKDCRHSVWPAPLAALYGETTYRAPMCGHPDARRSVVNGDLHVPCSIARGETAIVNSCRDVICLDAKLFEERPPIAPPLPESDSRQGLHVLTFEKDDSPGFWARVAGCIFGG